VDLEGAALGFDQLDFRAGKGLDELGGQTDRLGQVVSLHAVLDDGFHDSAADHRPRGASGEPWPGSGSVWIL
jgi:hypothetical protein